MGARRGARDRGMHGGHRKTRRRAADGLDGPGRPRVKRHAGSAQGGWLYAFARLAGRRPADLDANARWAAALGAISDGIERRRLTGAS